LEKKYQTLLNKEAKNIDNNIKDFELKDNDNDIKNEKLNTENFYNKIKPNILQEKILQINKRNDNNNNLNKLKIKSSTFNNNNVNNDNNYNLNIINNNPNNFISNLNKKEIKLENNNNLANIDFDINKISLYTIDKDSNFIKFGIKNCKFTKISTEKRKFYQYNKHDYKLTFNNIGTVILNTLNGLLILTGKNIDILYYLYENTIYEICQFKNNHSNGNLFIDMLKKEIYVFSGKFNKKVESYNYEKNIIKFYNDMNFQRCFSSLCLIGKNLYSIFGYNILENKYINNIEYINYDIMNKWITIEIINEIDINNYYKYFLSFSNSNNDNKIYIMGGVKNIDEEVNDNILEIDLILNKIKKVDIKLNESDNNFYNKSLINKYSNNFNFKKCSFFNKLPLNFTPCFEKNFDKNEEKTINIYNNIYKTQNYIAFDIKNDIHIIDDNFKYHKLIYNK